MRLQSRKKTSTSFITDLVLHGSLALKRLEQSLTSKCNIHPQCSQILIYNKVRNKEDFNRAAGHLVWLVMRLRLIEPHHLSRYHSRVCRRPIVVYVGLVHLRVLQAVDC